MLILSMSINIIMFATVLHLLELLRAANRKWPLTFQSEIIINNATVQVIVITVLHLFAIVYIV